MSWIRLGDEWNGAPEWMKAFEIAAARGDDRLVGELKGAAIALYTYSAQQWTDYIVGYGAAANLIGLTRVRAVLNDLITIGVLADESTQNEIRFHLLERANFVHLIRSDEKKNSAKRKRDQNRGSLQVPVLLRDGDQCRFCGVEVKWGDTRSDVGRTLEHMNIQEDTTPDNYAVCCNECNRLRKEFGPDADTELPILTPPETPIFGEELIKKLSRWRRLVEKEARRMGIPNPLTRGKVEAHHPIQQPAGDTDPHHTHHTHPPTPSPEPAGHQPAEDPQLPQASHTDAGRGRAATATQPRRATSTATHPFHPSPSPDPTDTQPAGDPQGHPETHVRASGPANETPDPPARKRRRRPRRR